MISHVQLFATLWTLVFQAPLSMEFFRQEYWSGLLFPTPGNLPYPGIKPTSSVFPERAGKFFTTVPLRITLLIKQYSLWVIKHFMRLVASHLREMYSNLLPPLPNVMLTPWIKIQGTSVE